MNITDIPKPVLGIILTHYFSITESTQARAVCTLFKKVIDAQAKQLIKDSYLTPVVQNPCKIMNSIISYLTVCSIYPSKVRRNDACVHLELNMPVRQNRSVVSLACDKIAEFVSEEKRKLKDSWLSSERVFIKVKKEVGKEDMEKVKQKIPFNTPSASQLNQPPPLRNLGLSLRDLGRRFQNLSGLIK